MNYSDAITVKLVSYTTPSKELLEESTKEDMTLLDLIAYIARVSNPSNQLNFESSEKLIKYLIKNAHWSPFELVHVCAEVYTTREISRQMIRHRTFTFQEFSQRYADPTKVFDFVVREARLQDLKNRQNSIEVDDTVLQEEWVKRQQAVIDLSRETYKWAIENNIAKEQARVVLPEGLTMTRLYMSGNIRSWIHYLQLRMGNGTQKEHIEIANMLYKAILQVFDVKCV